MILKGLVDEDFVNYKKASMFLIFPYCTFKCDKEAGCSICQNSPLAKEPVIEVDIDYIVKRYMNNPITHAIVCGGLEPFDTPDTLQSLIEAFRSVTNDDIVIYTGYTETEVTERFKWVYSCVNIVIKFGRFIAGEKTHKDAVLGVELASDNQYAKKFNPIENL